MTLFSSLLFLLPSLVKAVDRGRCRNDAFPNPKIPGVSISHWQVTEAHRYVPWPCAPGSLLADERPVTFCNVTLTYTHPGWNDEVNVYVWLPLDEKDWNGRFLGTGGGGWAAGFEGGLAPAAATDGSWLLHGPGVVNLPLLYDFAYVALDDMTAIAKRMVESFYGRPAEYSYWSGCSTGDRQGMAQAQRFPENYDGILSAAPAMNWASFVVAELWPQIVMNEMGVHPPACEFHAITEAAIEACDQLDGIRNNLVSAHGQCTFDPSTIVGKKIHCKGKTHTISQEAADIALKVWRGPQNVGGDIEWFGLPHEASFYIEEFGPFGGLVETDCPPTAPTDAKKCAGKPFIMSQSYLRYLVAKDPTFDARSLTREDFFRLLHQSRQEWLSVMDTVDPDLSAFRAAGGKMLHWHGVADQLIFVNGSTSYYSRVEAMDPDVRDFYRFYEVPGVTHCSGGPGPFPATALHSLVYWVEKGEAPDSIEGVVGKVKTPICAWPLVATYKGGNPDEATSFECKEDFGAFGFPKVQGGTNLRDEL